MLIKNVRRSRSKVISKFEHTFVHNSMDDPIGAEIQGGCAAARLREWLFFLTFSCDKYDKVFCSWNHLLKILSMGSVKRHRSKNRHVGIQILASNREKCIECA